MENPPANVAVLTIRVSLDRTRPKIWRRFKVRNDMTLDDLHDVIQISMGWKDSHLHHFSIARKRYGKIISDKFYLEEVDVFDEDQVLIADVLDEVGQKFHYLYDYGDSWRHSLIVEAIEPPLSGEKYPVCLEGERACPPEDCGGTSGYQQMLESLRNPKDRERESYLRWAGGIFDPDYVGLKEKQAILENFDDYVSGWDDDGEEYRVE